MSNKLILTFVALMAVSYVHCLPKLNDLVAQNRIQTYVQKLKALPKSSSEDKSGSGSDEASEWKDVFFAIFFDDDDDDSTDQNITKFSPDFEPSQFLERLNSDIEKSYRRRCKKISGSDDVYDKIKAAYNELGKCLKVTADDEELNAVTAKIESEEDFRTLVKTACNKRDGPLKCFDAYMAVDAQCSYPGEIESDNSFRTIMVKVLDLLCNNDGGTFMSLIAGEGHDCINESVDDLASCGLESIYSIVKAFMVKLIEDETFEFKMSAEDCTAYDDSKTCFVSSVQNCVDPTAKNYLTSVFEIVRNETSCHA